MNQDFLNAKSKILLDVLSSLHEKNIDEGVERQAVINIRQSINDMYQETLLSLNQIAEDPLHRHSIDYLELTVKSANCLKRSGVITISDLLKFTKETLASESGLDEKGVEEVLTILEGRGLELIIGNR